MHQAEITGRYVRSNFDLAAVWSSDLQRCMQTARTIGMPVTPSPLLRELDYGEWEGRLTSEIEAEFPDLVAQYDAGDISFQAPGGEVFSNLAVRGARFIKDSRVLETDGDIAIVGHGAAMKGLAVALLGLPATDMPRFTFHNCSVSVFSVSSSPPELTICNDTSHLVKPTPSGTATARLRKQ